MNKLEQINKLDAPLYVDFQCYRCKRRLALSNLTEIDGRFYCCRCGETVGRKGSSG